VNLESRLKSEARDRGFSLAGIAPATEADGFTKFTEWLDRGFAGEMDYLHEHREHRRHPSSILDNVRSVLMLGMEYGRKSTIGCSLPGTAGVPPAAVPDATGDSPPATGFVDVRGRDGRGPGAGSLPGTAGVPPAAVPDATGDSPPATGFADVRGRDGRGPGAGSLLGTAGVPPAAVPDATGDSPPATGFADVRGRDGRSPGAGSRIAAYAQGPEYHRFIWDRMNDLAAWLEAEVPGSRAHAVADTAPLLERDFARRAGLGWIGKNTLLIHPQRGSYFFLGALLTDLELRPDAPFEKSHCGTCTACLDACPTQAFPQPHVLDATKCISYLTIELRTPIPEELREPMGNWLWGCDVCQDVCPWNRKAPAAVVFPHDASLESLDPVELLGMDKAAFRSRFKKTSLWRNRRSGLLRNAAIVLGNTGDAAALPALRRALTDDPLIADAAAWAIARIESRSGDPLSAG
jgi:epoxyqueuosine reductase